MSFIYAFTIKRLDQILIKGLSFDKRNWYLMPEALRPLRLHKELCKYINEEELIQCKKVGRSSKVRFTKAIQAIYSKNGEFAIDGILLKKDDNLKDDSILNALAEEDKLSLDYPKGDF